MLAAVLHGIKDLRVDERPVPELEPGKVLVRVRRGGICGSDVHYFEEGRFGSFAVTAPWRWPARKPALSKCSLI